MTSTPASTSPRHRMSAPVNTSPIGSHSPEVAGVERLVLQLVRVADLVERVDQGARARLDDVGRRAVPGQRLPIDPRLDQDLPQAVPPRRDRLHRQVHHFHLTPHDFGDRCERRRNRPVAGGGRPPRPPTVSAPAPTPPATAPWPAAPPPRPPPPPHGPPSRTSAAADTVPHVT